MFYYIIQSIPAMNIMKNIFITSSISVVFGIYSFFQIFRYIQTLQNDVEYNHKRIQIMTDEIHCLKCKCNELNNTCNELKALIVYRRQESPMSLTLTSPFSKDSILSQPASSYREEPDEETSSYPKYDDIGLEFPEVYTNSVNLTEGFYCANNYANDDRLIIPETCENKDMDKLKTIFDAEKSYVDVEVNRIIPPPEKKVIDVYEIDWVRVTKSFFGVGSPTSSP